MAVEQDGGSVGAIIAIQDTGKRQAVVNTVMNLRVPQNAEHFLRSCGTVSLWRRTQVHGVSYVQKVRLLYYGYVPGSCTRTQVHPLWTHSVPFKFSLSEVLQCPRCLSEFCLPWSNNLNNSRQRTNTMKTPIQRRVSVCSVPCYSRLKSECIIINLKQQQLYCRYASLNNGDTFLRNASCANVIQCR